jgi:hypothetical protein
MLKDDYLKAIEQAGFRDVKVVEETVFPADVLLSDPNAQAVIKEARMSAKTLAGLVKSIVSVKVQATKRGG